MIVIHNGKLIVEEKIIENGSVLIEGNRITYAGDAIDAPVNCTVIDAENQYISPGFFDIHCHGGSGFDSYEQPEQMASAHLLKGSTSILPTIAYNVPMTKIKEGVSLIAAVIDGDDETNIEGIHLEGPYINRKYGAASQKAIDINPIDYNEILKRGNGSIRLWTLAPELEGIEPLIDLLSEYKIVMSAGHTEAHPFKIAKYMSKGLKNICHINNAMTFLPPNKTGCTDMGAGAAAFLYDALYAEVIPDLKGIHAEPAMLQLIFKIKGVDKTIIITDGTSSHDNNKNLKPGCEIVNDLRYVNNELSGSCLTIDGAVRNFIRHTRCSVREAVQCASHTPARLMGIDHEIGSLKAGKIANVIVFDENIHIKKVVLKGKVVI